MSATAIRVAELTGRAPAFDDRADAGRVLAGLLRPGDAAGAIVLAVPAGGVPVAVPIAKQLRLPLDVAVVSKITLPWNTERGYGAVAFDGTVRLDEALVERLGLDADQIATGVERTRAKVARRIELLRAGRPALAVAGRTAILVDDGLASGFTMRLAIDAARAAGASRVVVAVPTGHIATVEAIAPRADALYCANVRGGLSFAVADAYRRWYDVGDEELVQLLGR